MDSGRVRWWLQLTLADAIGVMMRTSIGRKPSMSSHCSFATGPGNNASSGLPMKPHVARSKTGCILISATGDKFAVEHARIPVRIQTVFRDVVPEIRASSSLFLVDRNASEWFAVGTCAFGGQGRGLAIL